MLLPRVPKITTNLMVTGHSLGGGLASAASLAGNIPATTYNSAGLQRHTLCEPIAWEAESVCHEISPGSLARFAANGSGLIDAYQVWGNGSMLGTPDAPDILSFLQEVVPVMPPAIGSRIHIEGLTNLTSMQRQAIQLSIFALGQVYDTGDWPQLVIGLITSLPGIAELTEAHLVPSYMFGLLHQDFSLHGTCMMPPMKM